MPRLQLSREEKLLLLSWMRSKPFYRDIILRAGIDKALAYYLRDKSFKRLQFILLALKTRNNKFKKKVPRVQVVTKVIEPDWKKYQNSVLN